MSSKSSSASEAVKGIGIVHRDGDVLVVDKPAGLLSVPGSTPESRDSVEVRLKRAFPTLRLIHRLDRDTSGLMVFALNYPVQRRLNEHLRERRFEKHYQAIVAGLVAEDEGEIHLPIAPDWPNRPRQQICHATGKAAQTGFRVIERDPLRNRTRLLLLPVTGRTHQLRLHASALGHPIPGCDLYAPHAVLAASARLLLHACGLGFPHPRTDEAGWFQSRPPF